MRAGTAIGRPAGIEAERDFIALRISCYAWFKGGKKRFKSILNTALWSTPLYKQPNSYKCYTIIHIYNKIKNIMKAACVALSHGDILTSLNLEKSL